MFCTDTIILKIDDDGDDNSDIRWTIEDAFWSAERNGRSPSPHELFSTGGDNLVKKTTKTKNTENLTYWLPPFPPPGKNY